MPPDWVLQTGALPTTRAFCVGATKRRCSRRDLLLQRSPLAWPLRDLAGYETACGQCEIHVRTGQMTPREWSRLLGDLQMDVRREGSHGLALRTSWPSLRLKQGDRVEPADHLLDWASLYTQQPEWVTFWRPSREGPIRHRNPLFDEALGTSVDQSYAIDTMHSWCLGIYQQWVLGAMWQMFEGPIFAAAEAGGRRRSMEERYKKNMQHLNSHLIAWYRSFSEEHPEVNITRVHDFNLDHLGGEPSKAQLRCKAHETVGLLRYLEAHLPEWEARIANGTSWTRGARSLLRMWTLLETAEGTVAERIQQANPNKPTISEGN